MAPGFRGCREVVEGLRRGCGSAHDVVDRHLRAERPPRHAEALAAAQQQQQHIDVVHVPAEARARVRRAWCHVDIGVTKWSARRGVKPVRPIPQPRRSALGRSGHRHTRGERRAGARDRLGDRGRRIVTMQRGAARALADPLSGRTTSCKLVGAIVAVEGLHQRHISELQLIDAIGQRHELAAVEGSFVQPGHGRGHPGVQLAVRALRCRLQARVRASRLLPRLQLLSRRQLLPRELLPRQQAQGGAQHGFPGDSERASM